MYNPNFSKKFQAVSQLFITMIFFGLIGYSVASASSLAIESTFWGQVAKEEGVDPYILYSVAILESGRKWGDGMVRPWPWTLNVNGRGIYFDTRMEALKHLEESRRDTGNIDVGILQVNIHYHGDKVARIENLLDYEMNLRVAARILREAILSSPGDPVIGVGRYHSWREKRARAYGARAIYLAELLRR